MNDTSSTRSTRQTANAAGSLRVAQPAPRRWTPIAIILVLALFVRGVAMWEARSARLVLDEQLYVLRANALLDGKGFVGSYQSWVRHPGSPYVADLPQYPGAYQPPGYVIFIAAVMGLTGRSILAVKAVQVVLSTLTVLVVYWIGRSWFDQRRGLVAAGICALYPNLIAFSHYLWTETFFIFLLVLAVWSLTRTRQTAGIVSCVLAGLLLGCAALTRSAIVYFLPVLLIWFVVTNAAQRHKALVGAAVVLATLVGTIAPWTARNYRLYDALVLLDINGSVNFWRGNAPNTFKPERDGQRCYYDPPFHGIAINPVGLQSERVLTSLAKRELGIDYPTDLQVLDFAKRAAWDYIRADPVAFIHRAGIKLVDMWNPTSFLIRHFRLGAYGPVDPIVEFVITWAAVITYALVMLLGLIGWYFWRRDGRAWLVLLLVLFFCAVHAVAFGLTRFRLPLMPFIILAAAHAVCLAYDALWHEEEGVEDAGADQAPAPTAIVQAPSGAPGRGGNQC